MKFHPKTFVFLQIKNVSKKMQPVLARYSWMRKKLAESVNSPPLDPSIVLARLSQNVTE